MTTKGIEGLPVLDAKQSVTLTITPNDVAKADIKDPSNCAAARACARQLHTEARVHLSRVYIKHRDHWTRFQTPLALRQELIAFDRGGTFAPGVYELEPVTAPSRKPIGKRQGTPPQKRGNKKLRKRPYHRITNVRNGPA